MKHWIRRGKDYLLHLLFPPKCVFCRKILENAYIAEEDLLCNVCIAEQEHSSATIVKKQGQYFVQALAPFYYEGKVSVAFRRFKFNHMPWYSGVFGKYMAQVVENHYRDMYDLITWIPVSEKRRKQRGFDQSLLLAEKLAAALNDSVTPTLQKHRDIQAQSSLSSETQRRENVSDVYVVLDSIDIKGKYILLVDDVITSGATMNEAAKTLLRAGAKEVMGITFAATRNKSQSAAVSKRV